MTLNINVPGLTESVGAGGKNRLDDVRLVRSWLLLLGNRIVPDECTNSAAPGHTTCRESSPEMKTIQYCLRFLGWASGDVCIEPQGDLEFRFRREVEWAIKHRIMLQRSSARWNDTVPGAGGPRYLAFFVAGLEWQEDLKTLDGGKPPIDMAVPVQASGDGVPWRGGPGIVARNYETAVRAIERFMTNSDHISLLFIDDHGLRGIQSLNDPELRRSWRVSDPMENALGLAGPRTTGPTRLSRPSGSRPENGGIGGEESHPLFRLKGRFSPGGRVILGGCNVADAALQNWLSSKLGVPVVAGVQHQRGDAYGSVVRLPFGGEEGGLFVLEGSRLECYGRKCQIELKLFQDLRIARNPGTNYSEVMTGWWSLAVYKLAGDWWR